MADMIVIDCESSGLHPESYPIEIAWLDVYTGEHDSFLIQPAPTWTYWDLDAERRVHKISRELLTSSGVPVQTAALRLNERLMGLTVYSDAVDRDRQWVSKLFIEAGVEQRFTLGDLHAWLSDHLPDDLDNLICDQEAPHRALADCIAIADIIKQIIPRS